MKVFFVVRGWPSESKPQNGIFERDQALALAKLGYEIVILIVNVRFKTICKKIGITKKIQDGFPLYELSVHSLWLFKLLKLFSVLKYEKIIDFFFMRLFRHVVTTEGQPDLIYSHYLPFSAMAVAAKNEFDIPVVGMEHWSELGSIRIKKYIKVWADYTYHNLDFLLTVSSALQENIQTSFGINSVVVNNMLGEEFLTQTQIRANKELTPQVKFIAIGNLIPRKGFDILIKALHTASLPKNLWSLSIVGGGDEYNTLQKMIDKCGLTDNIHLLGRKDRNSVIALLRQSDVYVLSSYSETFGVSAIEALACGLPVISTECGGSRDFMTKENGITCPVGDVIKMADALTYMFLHYTEYNREEISETCLRKFSPFVISQQLDNVFTSLVQKKYQSYINHDFCSYSCGW